MTVRLKGLLKKLNNWIIQLDENSANVIDVRNQVDKFMNGILISRYSHRLKQSFYVPFQDPKIIFLPYKWTEVSCLTVKPYIPTSEELKAFLFEVKDLIVQDMLKES